MKKLFSGPTALPRSGMPVGEGIVIKREPRAELIKKTRYFPAVASARADPGLWAASTARTIRSETGASGSVKVRG